MKLVSIESLIDKNVDGLVVDIRSRGRCGSLMYDYETKDAEDSYMTTLISVTKKKSGGRDWLRWEFKPPKGAFSPCGYSAVALSMFPDPDFICDYRNYHLLVDDKVDQCLQG